MNYPKSFRAAVRSLAASTDARRLMLVAVALAPATGAQLLTAQTPAPEAAPAASASAPAADQTAGTGSITGRVINGENGKYLSKATVTVKGTNRQVLTDEFGNYTLLAVPVGEVTLEVGYTGQESLSAVVSVSANDIAIQDFSFGRRRAADGAILLDEFQVQTDRIKNAREMAINEERYAVNIKNVVATDQFGDIPSGNVGEFVKFMPGVQVDYGSFNGNNQGYADGDATGVSVRGFGPADTAILIDGLPVSSATPGDLSRQVALDQLSINNASRVELIKVATPDMPANSVGGQVNLVTKSAFEQSKPSYGGRVFFNVNSLAPDFRKTPGPTNTPTYKVQPGMEFNATLPISNSIGVTFTGSASNQFNQTYVSAPTWNISNTTTASTIANAAGNVISLSNPVLSRSQVTDSSQLAKRKSGNVRLDWKPTPSQVLRFNVQYSTFAAEEGQRRLDFRPTIAAGADWGSNYVVGTAANSTIAQTVTTRDREGDTIATQLQYTLKKGGWKVDAAGSISVSSSEFKDITNGHYSESAYNLSPGRVSLYSIDNGAPGGVISLWRTTAGALANTPKDYTLMTNWTLDGNTAKSGQAINKSTVGLYKLDVERDLSFIPFLGGNSLSLKFGGRRDEEKIEKSGLGTGYAEILKTGATYALADVIDYDYIGQTPGFGLPGQQWGSNYKLYQLNQERSLFEAPADGAAAVSNYNSYANQQKSITDTKDAYYAMLSGNFFKNKLTIVGGARQEISLREGLGPQTVNTWNFAKTADGRIYKDSFYKAGVTFNGSSVIRTNADGTTTTITNFLTDSALLARLTAAGVQYPDHLYGPTNTSLESRKLQLVANRYVKARVTGDPSFSLNTVYRLTEKIDVKTSVSRSFKQPSLESAAAGLLSGNGAFTINENTTIPADGTVGTISVANPNLLPEVSANYDMQIAYYTESGGSLSIAYFQKHITNQVETNSSYYPSEVFITVLDAIGLDPEAYKNFRLNTSYNSSGKQKTDGWEFEARQDLGFLAPWAKRMSVFASYSFNSLGDPTPPVPYSITTPTGVVVPITPTVTTITKRANKFGGAGFQYSGRRFSAQIRGTYRNENELGGQRITLVGANAGNYLRRFEPARTSVDVNLGLVLTKRYSLFLSGRDVLHGDREEIWKDDFGIYPSYAETASYREFGTTWTFGVNGKF